jgi:hypothetical protein
LEVWSRQELLAHAVRRGAMLRRRRQVLRGAVAVAAVAIIAVPVMALSQGDEGAARVRTVDSPSGGRATTTSTTLGQPAAMRGRKVDDNSGSTTTTTAAPAPAQAARQDRMAGTTSTTVGRQGRIEAKPTDRTPSACAANQVSFSATTDMPAYVAGQTVHVTGHITNDSGHWCYVPSEDSVAFTDASGRQMGPGMTTVREYVGGTAWAPGQTLDASYDWDQRCTADQPCTAGLAPRGRYTASVRWGSGDAAFGPATAAFDLR